MTLIKNGSIVENHWTHLADDDSLPDGPFTVSLGRWRSERETLPQKSVGVRLRAEDDPEKLCEDLPRLELIVLEMALFTDGRLFSSARLLRDRWGFGGEIRAQGDFLRDQMLYLARVGVDAFEFPEETPLEDRLRAFSEFTVNYQKAVSNDPYLRMRA